MAYDPARKPDKAVAGNVMSRSRFKGQSAARRPGGAPPRGRSIVICVDGEKTEAEYFRGWRRKLGQVGIELRSYTVTSGGNAYEAVEASIRKMQADPDADEYWCVCDVDDTSKQDLQRAVALAHKTGINLCLSCRSFEVWLALHWEQISTAVITNEKQAKALVARHYAKYATGPKEVPFELLFPNTERAIKNAEWLEQQLCENPSTMVHRLVEKLSRLMR
jgi:hypothetical protein